MITIVFGPRAQTNVIDMVRTELSKDDQKRTVWIPSWEAIVGVEISLHEDSVTVWKVERILATTDA